MKRDITTNKATYYFVKLLMTYITCSIYIHIKDKLLNIQSKISWYEDISYVDTSTFLLPHDDMNNVARLIINY